MQTPDRAILRLLQVLALVGLSRSTLYHFIKLDMFPPPIKLGKRASAWLKSDIDRWLSERAMARRMTGK